MSCTDLLLADDDFVRFGIFFHFFYSSPRLHLAAIKKNNQHGDVAIASKINCFMIRFLFLEELAVLAARRRLGQARRRAGAKMILRSVRFA